MFVVTPALNRSRSRGAPPTLIERPHLQLRLPWSQTSKLGHPLLVLNLDAGIEIDAVRASTARRFAAASAVSARTRPPSNNDQRNVHADVPRRTPTDRNGENFEDSAATRRCRRLVNTGRLPADAAATRSSAALTQKSSDLSFSPIFPLALRPSPLLSEPEDSGERRGGPAMPPTPPVKRDQINGELRLSSRQAARRTSAVIVSAMVSASMLSIRWWACCASMVSTSLGGTSPTLS